MLQSFSVIAPDRSRVSGVRSEWHSRGQRFDPAYLHQNKQDILLDVLFVFAFSEKVP